MKNVPSGWKVSEIGDHVDLLTGFPFKSSAYSSDSCDIRLLRGDNVIQSSIRWEDAKYWSRKSVEGLESYFTKPGDIVMAMDRTWVKAGLKCAVIKSADTPCLLVQRVARIRGQDGLETPFAAHIFGSHRFVQYVQSVKTETAIPHISPQQIRDFTILLPPVEEQRQIAEILNAWETAMTVCQSLLVAKEERKRGLMQQLLTGQTRFKAFKGEPWQKLSAGKMFQNRSQRNDCVAPVLSVTQDQGIVLRASLDRRISADEDNHPTYKLVLPGDFVISLRSFQGGLEYSPLKGAVSPAYHVITPKIEISADFYRHYFKSYEFIERLAVTVVGIRDGKQINFGDFEFLKLPYPTVEEQKRIAAVLDTCDQEIGLLQKQLEALKEQKRGLMQKLLTGEVRVRCEDRGSRMEDGKSARGKR